AAPGVGPELDMDWDDDELATQIYDVPKDTPSSPGMLGAPASPATPQLGYGGAPSHGPLSTAPTTAPAVRSGAPSPFDDLPASPPARGPAPPSGAPSPFDLGPEPAPSEPPRLREPTAVTARPESKGGLGLAAIVGIGLAIVGAMGAAAWFLLRPPAPGTIHLTTSPVDPVVLFDEQPVQATSSPFIIANVEAGVPHLIEVRKRGYRVWSMQVEVQPGQTLELPPVTLVPEEGAEVATGPTPPGGDTNGPTPTAGTAGFSLTTDPPGAKVFVDGVEKGVTPLTLSDLAAGSRRIRVELEGRAPWETSLNLVDGRILPLADVTLAASVNVRFESEPSGARVTLVRGDTRQNVGTTPTETTIDPSGWTVEMVRSGYETWTEPLNVPSGRSTHRVSADLERVAVSSPMVVTMRDPVTPMVTEMITMVEATEMVAATGGSGTLRINSRPWSQVFIDGRLIGNTPQMNISLASGRHQVTLVNPDFNIRHTITVNVSAGETVTRIVDLPMP
ncbi:MAG: PEGA domain-containing protein, partial [Myxococcales bacterium]|nr:PEGA domain-containing protein [Myxococcales bacterium]